MGADRGTLPKRCRVRPEGEGWGLRYHHRWKTGHTTTRCKVIISRTGPTSVSVPTSTRARRHRVYPVPIQGGVPTSRHRKRHLLTHTRRVSGSKVPWTVGPWDRGTVVPTLRTPLSDRRCPTPSPSRCPSPLGEGAGDGQRCRVKRKPECLLHQPGLTSCSYSFTDYTHRDTHNTHRYTFSFFCFSFRVLFPFRKRREPFGGPVPLGVSISVRVS